MLLSPSALFELEFRFGHEPQKLFPKVPLQAGMIAASGMPLGECTGCQSAQFSLFAACENINKK